jgi:U3 small nucleolar RNA-associated protein 15
VLDNRSQQSVRSFRHFKQMAYSGSYRADGQLLVAGGDDPVVQIFDATQTKLDLKRSFRGHTACVVFIQFMCAFVELVSLICTLIT